MDLTTIKNFLDHWQSLVGSFVGAFIPITFSIYINKRADRKEKKRELKSIEFFLVHSIQEITDFLDEFGLFLNRLKEITKTIETSDRSTYFLASSNFPSLQTEYSSAITTKYTGSLYLSNKLLRSYVLLKNVASSIHDFKDEFAKIVDRNYQIVLSYKDPSQRVGVSPRDQNNLYLDHLGSLGEVLEKTVYTNLITTLRSLVAARIIYLKYTGKVGFFYKLYYEGLDGKLTLRDNGQVLVENKFSKELEKELNRLLGSS